jgi:PTH1 family peptidyl-tRNA hydrolase
MTYAHTRHNVGFMVIEALAKRHHVSLSAGRVPERHPTRVCGSYRLRGQEVRLMMPLTMMNDSGRALEGLGVVAEDTLIVFDDVNLPFGTLRLRAQGGDGGHHGMASCIEVLATDTVPRVRFGVGVEPLPRDLRDFVLSPFSEAEQALLPRMIDQAADACETWVIEGMDVAMNRYNMAIEK